MIEGASAEGRLEFWPSVQLARCGPGWVELLGVLLASGFQYPAASHAAFLLAESLLLVHQPSEG